MFATLIKKTYPVEDIILRVLKDLMKEDIKIENDTNYLIMYHAYNNIESIRLSLETLSNDLLFPLYAYTSLDLNERRIKEEVEIAKILLDNIPSGFYTLKEALLKNQPINEKKQILDFILDGTGINEEFVIGFAEANLNVSLAAKLMFLHRNTMLYKLNKLKELTGFDLREFKDTYILYGLLSSKWFLCILHIWILILMNV